MEGNNEGDNEFVVENKARVHNPKGLHIFHTCILYLIGLQGLLRVLLFIFKRRMQRYLTIEELGLQTVQFHTFTAWIFSISREGFRCGCLRQNKYGIGHDIDSKCVQSNSRILAAAWLAVPWGIIITVGTLLVVMWLQGLHVIFDYNSSLFILGVATILELCVEPLYILAQHLMLLRLRVLIEGTATISQCVVTYILVRRGIGLNGGLAFAYAQLAYSCCLILCYWSYFLSSYQGTIFPFKLIYYKGKVFFKRNLRLDVSLIKLCVVLTLELGLSKFILQESEKLVLVLYETTYNQGIYGLVDNIGSLLVRFIFQPFEESAFIMFAQKNSTNNGIDKKNNNNCDLERMVLLALKLATFIGLIFVALGPNFAYVLLCVYNKDWSDGNATDALGYYCIYILTLAINGISEAFLRAVMPKQELLNWASIAKLVFFPIASIYLCRVSLYVAPSNGPIIAKSIIMGMQVCHGLHFIRQYFKHSQTFSLWQALPDWRVLGVFMTTAMITYLTKSFVLDFKNFFPTASLHIGVGMACLGGLSLAVVRYDRTFLQEIVAFQNKKRD